MSRRRRALPAPRRSLLHRELVVAGGAEVLEDRALLATFTVDNTDDSGGGSLRDAVSQANATPGLDEIRFESQQLFGQTINLTSGELVITEEVQIRGFGQGSLTIDAGGNSRVFDVTSAVTGNAEFSNFTISGGNASHGAGLRNAGTLRLFDVGFTNNTATSDGGGIYNSGTLDFGTVTVSGNTATGSGGGIYNAAFGILNHGSSTTSGNMAASGAGIFNAASATSNINTSTISGNTATADGGGVATTGNVYVQDSTISGNMAANGGGVHGASGANISIQNSTLSGNTASAQGGGVHFSGGGTATVVNATFVGNSAAAASGGGVFSGSTVAISNTIITTSSGGDVSGTITGTNNRFDDVHATSLGAVTNLDLTLSDNGGQTLTHRLNAGSNAIDAGSDAAAGGLFQDQRQFPFPRFIDMAPAGGDTIDVGAFEFGPYLTITSATELEGDAGTTSFVFTFTRSDDSTDVSLNYETFDGTATVADSDYVAISPAQTLNFTMGSGILTDTVTVTVNGDTNPELTETFLLLVTNMVGIGSVSGTPVGTIVNDEATLTVNTASDPTSPIDVGCTVTECTLREAIDFANNNGPGLVIDFLAGLGGSTITLDSANGELQITEAMTIRGLGSDDLTVSGDGSSRVFNIDSPTFNADVYISGLTIRDGDASGSGGGIFSRENLTLTDVVVTDNVASSRGGGIISEFGGTLTIADSVISNNEANNGGGLVNEGGTLVITNTEIRNNEAERTGGIENRGTMSISGSTISGNTARDAIAAISNSDNSTLTISTTTISDNVSENRTIYNQGTLTIQESTISGNTATNGEGGGLYNGGFDRNQPSPYPPASGTATILNSTISGNSATDEGGGIWNNTTGSLTIVNSTLVSNNAATGGGIFAGTPVSISNSIITNSSGGDFSGTLTGVNNLFDDAHASSSGPVTNIDLTLHPFGGPTLVHAILAGSNAIDAGDNASASGLTTDQRSTGFARTINAQVDVGAYEYDNPFPQLVQILDASVLEGDAGTTNLVFEVFLNDDTTAVDLTYETQDITADAAGDNDYVAISGGNLTLPAGGGNNHTITVLVNGDTDVEPDELLRLQLLTATGSGSPTLFDAEGIGTILNDDRQHYLVNSAADPATVDIGCTVVECTLREAVEAANAGAVDSQIDFDPGLGGSTITLTTGQLLSTVDLVVAGLGASSLTISGNDSSRILLATQPLEIQGVTIIDGAVTDDSGAGILAASSLTITDSVFSNNTITGDGGGGAVISTGPLVISGSTFTGNAAPGSGGGAIATSANYTITDTTVSGNTAQFGGGFFTSEFSASGLIVDSTFSNNTGTGAGGGIVHLGPLTITGSTISGNFGGSAFSGGGMTTLGTLNVVNSTISGNSTSGAGGGVMVQAAFAPVTATFTNTTIAGNSATGGGGGIGNDSSTNPANVFLYNSIVTASTGGDFQEPTVVGNNNLIDDTTGGGAAGRIAAVTGFDPLLANNGGPTLTHRIFTGSNAENAGNNSDITGFATDQRGAGFPRIVDTTVDIGAVEGVSGTPSNIDYGDAPDTAAGTGAGNYETLSANGGPSHTIVSTIFMGATIDGESDALQNGTASGDDLFGDDEDGLNDPTGDLTLTEGVAPSVDVTVTNNSGSDATLYGWIDYDGDGVFEAGEMATSGTITTGTSGSTVTLTFPVVPSTFAASTFARFRFSTDAAAIAPTGAATDGEVEDYPATISPAGPPATDDFGDAPDTSGGTGSGDYQTTAANGGPQHTVVADIRLGAATDAENDGLQSAAADGDDSDNTDDEDGLNDPTGDLTLTEGVAPSIDVTVTNDAGLGDATLYGWIDYNGDGVFDNGSEHASIAVPNGTNGSTVTLVFPAVPTGAASNTFARFRLSTDTAASNPTGAASDGEVEDYPVTISPANPPTTTISLNGVNLQIEDDAGDTDDTLTITTDGTNVIIHDPNNTLTTTVPNSTGDGTNTVTVPLAEFSGDINVLTQNGDDSVTVDFSVGNFTRTINYDGGGQTGSPGDTLSLTGGGVFASVGHIVVDASSGTINVDGNSPITYTGLEPVMDDLGVVDRTIEFTGAAETITLSDDGTAGDGVSFIDSTLGESYTFTNPTGSLTIETSTMGGTGVDTINVIGLDSTWAADLTINGDSDDLLNFLTNATDLGGRTLTGSALTISVSADVTTSSSGGIDLDAVQNVTIDNSATVESEDGAITIDANPTGTATGNFEPVRLDGATVQATGVGSVTIDGRGSAAGTANGLNGIELINTPTISTQSGAILLTGTGGAAPAFGGHSGIAGSGIISSDSGAITLIGTGGSGTSSTLGVIIAGGGSITSNSGDIVVNGTGGTGTTLQNNAGVRFDPVANVQTAGAGTISITGVGGGADNAGNGFGNAGIRLTSIVQTEDGDITLDGTGGGYNPAATGIDRRPNGVFMNGSSAVRTTGNGNVTITATSGDAAIHDLLLADTATLGSTTTGADYTINADTIEIGATASLDSGGALLIQPRTASTTIGLGGGAGTLNIDDTELTRLADGFSSITIGNTSAGTVNVSSSAFRDDVTIIGDDINVTGALTNLANEDVSLQSGDVISLTSTGSVATTGNGSVGLIAARNVSLQDGSSVTSFNGDITIEANTAGTAVGVNNGIDIGTFATTGPTQFARVESTGAGAITMDGTHAVGGNYGVAIEPRNVVQTNTGNISLTGVGTAAVLLRGSLLSVHSTSGDITVVGRGTNHGFFMSAAGALLSSDSGDVTIDAIGTASADIFVSGSIGSGSASGDITLLGDEVTLNAASSLQSMGHLLIEPQTASTTIGLGGGVGTLELDDTELSRVMDGFSSITIGDTASGTGTVDIDTATFRDPVTIAGGVINDNAAPDITMTTGTDTATLAGNVSPGQSPGVLNVTGNYAFADGSSFEAEIDGGNGPGNANGHDQIAATGTVTIGSGVSLNLDTTNLTAGEIPVATSITVVDNGSGLPVTGTFSGLPEGATVISGAFAFTITYVGGVGGNDILLTAQATDTLVVDTAVDETDGDHTPGDLSLREAIDLANDSATFTNIEFNIAGGGNHTITLQNALGALPTVTDEVFIDGSTQPAGGIITVDASNIGNATPLTVTASDTTLQDFVIRDAPLISVLLNGADRATVDGLDVSDPALAYASDTGIRVQGGSDDVTIQNVTATNKNLGVIVTGGTDVRILNNDLTNSGEAALTLDNIGSVALAGGILVQGNTYTGAARDGVVLANLTNQIISDGSVAGTNITLENTSGLGTAGIDALTLSNVDDSLVDTINVSDPGANAFDTGIRATNSDTLTIQNVSATDKSSGIVVSGGTDVQVLNSDLSTSTTTALLVDGVGSVSLPGGIIVQGNTYSGATGDAVTLSNLTNQTISDGSVAGTNVTLENTSGLGEAGLDALTLANVDDSLVDTIDVSDPLGNGFDTGIRVQSGSDTLTIQNVTATDKATAIIVTDGSDVQVLNSNLSDSGMTALSVSAVASVSLPGGIFIQGNDYSGALGSAVVLSNMTNQTISDGSIAGSNVILENTSGLGEAFLTALTLSNIDDSLVDTIDVSDPLGNGFDIGVRVQNGSETLTIQNVTATDKTTAITVNGGSDVQVLNNDLSDSTQTALTVSNVTSVSVSGGILIQGNDYSGALRDAVVLSNMANQTISDGSVAGTNVFLENTSGLNEAASNALTLSNIDDSLVDTIDVSDPLGNGFDTGIRVNSGSETLTIQNVLATDKLRAITISGGSDVQILNNDLSDSSTAALTVTMVTSISLPGGLLIQGNTYAGAVRDAVVLSNLTNQTISDGSVAGSTVILEDTSGLGEAGSEALTLQNVTNSLVDGIDVSDTAMANAFDTGISISTSSTVTVQNVTATDKLNGVFVSGGSDFTMSCTILQNNTTGIRFTNVSNAVMFDNHIEGNTTGVFNGNVDPLIDAENNYWGASDGPSNLGGSGNGYTGNVDADPFLTSIPGCTSGVTTELTLDGSGNLVITDINGGDTDDLLTVQADATNSVFVISDPNHLLTTTIAGATGDGTMTITIPFASVTGSQIIVDTLGGDDSLTVDLTLGGFDAAGSSVTDITYTGGTQNTSPFGDGLAVVGNGTSTTGVYTPDLTTTGNGTVVVDGTTTITFTGLEPVDMTGMVTATLSLPLSGANDTLDIAEGFNLTGGTAGTIPALVVTGTTGDSALGAGDGTAIEAVAFYGNTTVVIDTTVSDGADQIVISSAANAHANDNLKITTGTGGDTLNIDGDVTVSGDVLLDIGGSVTQQAGDVITATGLALMVDGTTSLDEANDVDTFAADNGDQTLFTNTDALSVGSVTVDAMTVTGITTSSDDVKLTINGGDLDIDDDVSLGSGDLFLDVNGAVTQQAGDTIAAGGLGLMVTGNTTLNEANNVSTLAAGNGGTIGYTDVDDVTIDSVTVNGMTVTGITTSDDNLNVTATDGDITVDEAISVGSATVTLDANTTSPGDEGTAPEGSVHINADITTDSDLGDITINADHDITADGTGTISLGAVSLATISLNADTNGSGLGGNNDGTIMFAAGADIFASEGTLNFSLTDCDGEVLSDITAAGDINKAGSGQLALGGTSSYAGTTTVNAGILSVTGTLTDSTPTVGGVSVASGGVLGGNGTITADVTVASGGTVDPGTFSATDCSPETGILSVTGDVDFADGSTFRVQLNGLTVGSGYDQLDVTGSVNIKDANPESVILETSSGFAAPVGAQFVIVNNDDTEGIAPDPGAQFVDTDGTTPLPEGAFLTSGGTSPTLLNITYVGNVDDNDIVLTRVGRFDFNAPSDVTATDYEAVAPGQTNPTSAAGWASVDKIGTFDRTAPDALLRDGHFGREFNPGTFLVDVVPGTDLAPLTYQVTVTFGDLSFQHDQQRMTVSSPFDAGSTVTSSAAAGTWTTETFTVQVGDVGQISLLIENLGGNHNWVINALDVRPATPGSSSVGLLTLARADALPGTTPVDADGVTVDSYTGAGAPPNSLVTISATGGTVTSTDTNATYNGVQVMADALGNFSFTLQRPSGSDTVTITAAEVSGLSLGTFTQSYDIAAQRRFDMNTSGGLTGTGFIPVRSTPAYSTATGFGWVGQPFERDRGAGSSDVRRDLHTGNDATFQIEVMPDVNYDVRLYLGDAALPHRDIEVYVEGVLQTTVTTEAGEFYLDALTGVSSNDGILDIQLVDPARHTSFALAAIDIAESATGLPGTAPLRAVGTNWADPQGDYTLTTDEIAPVLTAAISRWETAGWDVTPLQDVRVRVDDLVGTRLAMADDIAGMIIVDVDAAGWGWFVDPTPNEDSEFATGSSVEGMDLLTTLAHDLGHLLGLEDLPPGASEDNIMVATLSTGIRRQPHSPELIARTPDEPDIVAPGSHTHDARPVIDWEGTSYAVQYDVRVLDVDTGRPVLRQQTENETSLRPLSSLADGNYRLWVRAGNSEDEWSAWSPGLDFTIDDGVTMLPDGTLQVVGTADDDVITVTELADTIEVSLNGVATSHDRTGVTSIRVAGRTGDDQLTRLGQSDLPTLLDGGPGHDVLTGGDSHDLLIGRGGNDVLVGGGGNDLLRAGGGDDQLDGGAGDDILGAGSGNDIADGGAGDDRISGGRGRDVIRGGEGADDLDGSYGADILLGGAGVDHLVGGRGRDLLIGGSSTDTLRAGGHSDLVIAGQTAFDNDPGALQLILAEWNSGRDYETRVANLTDGSGPGNRLNGDVFLPPAVLDGAADESVIGGTDNDWFFADLDEIIDLASGEFAG